MLNDSGDALCAARDAKSISSRYHAQSGFYYYSGVATLIIIISSRLSSILLTRRVTDTKNPTRDENDFMWYFSIPNSARSIHCWYVNCMAMNTLLPPTQTSVNTYAIRYNITNVWNSRGTAKKTLFMQIPQTENVIATIRQNEKWKKARNITKTVY